MSLLKKRNDFIPVWPVVPSVALCLFVMTISKWDNTIRPDDLGNSPAGRAPLSSYFQQLSFLPINTQ